MEQIETNMSKADRAFHGKQRTDWATWSSPERKIAFKLVNYLLY